MEDIKRLQPRAFTRFCMSIGAVPSSYLAGLTIEEQLLWFCSYLQNEVIPAVNNNAGAVEELQALYTELKSYVDNYFDNLDVQEEINNKLDEMATDGTLAEIIAQYVQLQGILSYNSIADLKAAENLVEGCFVETYGYYSYGDGGSAKYKVRQVTNQDVENDMDIIALHDENLVAELIIEEQEIDCKKIGVHADKETDDLTTLQNAIDLCKSKKLDLILSGYCYVSDTIDTKGIKIKGVGEIVNPSIVYHSATYGNIGYDYLKNVDDGALITFEDYVSDTLKYGSGIISDTASPIIECNIKDGHFDLYNLTICGWLRTANQKGILSTYDNDVTYIYGHHIIDNVSVINCGGNGIELQNLESTTFKNNIIKLNGGYGLYIKGDNNIDAPTEYSNIIDNTIEGNFNNGIYIKDGFRKLLTIQNNNFSRNGLYVQLGVTPPNDNTVVSGVVIENRPSTAANQDNLIFNSNYGEEVQTLIKVIIGNVGNNIFNDIIMKNNVIYPVNNNSYLTIIDGVYYSNNFEFEHNYTNGGNIINENIENLGYLQPALQNVPVTYIQSLTTDGATCQKQGQHVHIEFFGNFGAEVAQYQALVSGLPKSITNNRIRCVAYLINPTTGAYLKTIMCSLTQAGILQNEETIANGSRITFYLDYICYDNVL